MNEAMSIEGKMTELYAEFNRRFLAAEACDIVRERVVGFALAANIVEDAGDRPSARIVIMA